MRYLQIINTFFFFLNNMSVWKQYVWETYSAITILKVLVGPALLEEYWSKHAKYCLQDNHIILFKKSVDNFEIEHKTCSILVWGAVSSKLKSILLQFWQAYRAFSQHWMASFPYRTREVNNRLTGWANAHPVNWFAHPVNSTCPLPTQ